MICVYKITSPFGRVYIGQTWNWTKRKSVYRRIACPGQLYLYNSLNINKGILVNKLNGRTKNNTSLRYV